MGTPPLTPLLWRTSSTLCVPVTPVPALRFCPRTPPRSIADTARFDHAIANGWIRKMQDALGCQLVLSGMANCHRTDVLVEMGGFPDDNITEDFNLTWALHRRGYPVAFTPK